MVHHQTKEVDMQRKVVTVLLDQDHKNRINHLDNLTVVLKEVNIVNNKYNNRTSHTIPKLVIKLQQDHHIMQNHKNHVHKKPDNINKLNINNNNNKTMEVMIVVMMILNHTALKKLLSMK